MCLVVYGSWWVVGFASCVVLWVGFYTTCCGCCFGSAGVCGLAGFMFLDVCAVCFCVGCVVFLFVGNVTVFVLLLYVVSFLGIYAACCH